MFKKGKDYRLEDILEYAEDKPEFEIKEYGPNFIGEQLLVVSDEKRNVKSFLLTGATSESFIYTLVYKD